MSRTKKLINNTLIFALGTFGSKFLQYLLLPYYTYLLSTQEYGIIDNLQNIGSLCLPIVSLTIYESVFRYAMDKKYDNKKVFSIGLYISILGCVVFGGLCLLVGLFTKSTYILLIYLYVCSNVLRNNSSQYTRAIGEVRLFSIDNIVQTLLILVSNVIFLSYFKLGISGYMMAYIVGNFLSFIFLWIVGKQYKGINLKDIEKDLLSKMLKYSTPLIPNTVCWWVSNCSARFVITAFLGSAANGLYSIACKIPTLMTVLINIFLQAWQISANEEVDGNYISTFYSKMFKYISILLCFMSLFISTFAKLIIFIITDAKFFASWYYIPILTISIVFFAKAQFLGTVYTAFKQTKMAFYSNLIAAVINIVGNIVLVYFYGEIGAAISTAISYFVLWIVRQYSIYSFIELKFNLKTEIITTILVIVNAIIVMTENMILTGISFIVVLCTLLYLFRDEIKEILKKFRII